MLEYRNVTCMSFPEHRVDDFRSELRLAKQRVVPCWRSQAIEADFMYSCYRFGIVCRGSCIPNICGASHNSEKDVYGQFIFVAIQVRSYTPFSTLIRPRHPLIVLFESFTRLLWSIFLVERRTTIAWDSSCPTRNRSARRGRPRRSSFSSVMRYRVRGLVPRYSCITAGSGCDKNVSSAFQALISWMHLFVPDNAYLSRIIYL